MSRSHRVPRDLADAAAVLAARDAIVLALGPLAASPLDEQATARMQAALGRAESVAVRRAIRRLARPGESRPPLQAVPSLVTERPGRHHVEARQSCPIVALAPVGAA